MRHFFTGFIFLCILSLSALSAQEYRILHIKGQFSVNTGKQEKWEVLYVNSLIHSNSTIKTDGGGGEVTLKDTLSSLIHTIFLSEGSFNLKSLSSLTPSSKESVFNSAVKIFTQASNNSSPTAIQITTNTATSNRGIAQLVSDVIRVISFKMDSLVTAAKFNDFMTDYPLFMYQEKDSIKICNMSDKELSFCIIQEMKDENKNTYFSFYPPVSEYFSQSSQIIGPFSAITFCKYYAVKGKIILIGYEENISTIDIIEDLNSVVDSKAYHLKHGKVAISTLLPR